MNLRDELRGIAAFCILTVGVAFGVSAEPLTDAPPKKPVPTPKKTLRKVEINAASYHYGNDRFIAKGAVEIVDGDMVLTADQVEVTLLPQKTSTETGKKSSPFKSMTAIGTTKRVILKTTQGQAVADRIEYDLTQGDGRALLSGKPEVTLVDGGRLFGAKSVVLDRTKQRLWTVGGKPKAIIPNDGGREGLLASPKPDKAAKSDQPKVVRDKGTPVSLDKTVNDKAKVIPATATKTTTQTPRPPTEIEAEKMVYDMKTNVIRCEGSVHVVDEELDLKATLLEVFRNKAGVTTRIVATGGEEPVLLETVMEDYKRGVASGPKLVYDMAKQTMVLSGKANLKTERGQFRDVERVDFKKTKSGFSVDVKNGDIGKFILWTDESFLDLNKKKRKKTKKVPPATDSKRTDGGESDKNSGK